MKRTVQIKLPVLVCTLLCFSLTVWGGDHGSAVIAVFSDIHSGFGTVNDDRGFGLERAYLGYCYTLPKGVELKVVADFGRMKEVDDNQRVGFLKNAMLSWKQGGWTLNAGLIPTLQFKQQEEFWGKRYVMKSFQDEYAMGSSADLAVSVAYRFSEVLSVDAIVANGEGYKKVQVKDGLLYGAGLTVNPVRALTLRLYGAYNEPADSQSRGMVSLASFVGYRTETFSLAAEYNHQLNSKYTGGLDMSGVSVYSSVEVGKRISLFARWDYLDSRMQWNAVNDGMAGIAGAEFRLGRYIRLSPNFRVRTYRSEKRETYYVYLNAAFSI